MDRILALDVGEKRIGIAVSDPLGFTAQPVETLQRVGYGPDVRRITELSAQYGTKQLLLGLPRNMNGSEGPQVERTRAYGDQLERAGFTVSYWDERLTTVTAERTLIEGGVRRESRRDYVDKLAATILLQAYLDAQSQQKKVEANNMQENDSNIVELIGEDGEEVRFEHMMTLEHKGESYIVLAPADAETDEEAGEVVIMRISTDAEGADCYVLEENEVTLQEVFDRFVEIIEEEDDEIPEEEDEE